MIYLSADSCIWLVTRDSKVHFTPAQLFILLWGINWKLPERTALLQTQQNTIYQIAEYNRQKDLLAKLQRMQFGKSSEKLRVKTERQIQEVQERTVHFGKNSGNYVQGNSAAATVGKTL